MLQSADQNHQYVAPVDCARARLENGEPAGVWPDHLFFSLHHGYSVRIIGLVISASGAAVANVELVCIHAYIQTYSPLFLRKLFVQAFGIALLRRASWPPAWFERAGRVIYRMAGMGLQTTCRWGLLGNSHAGDCSPRGEVLGRATSIFHPA